MVELIYIFVLSSQITRQRSPPLFWLCTRFQPLSCSVRESAVSRTHCLMNCSLHKSTHPRCSKAIHNLLLSQKSLPGIFFLKSLLLSTFFTHTLIIHYVSSWLPRFVVYLCMWHQKSQRNHVKVFLIKMIPWFLFQRIQ